MSSSRPSFSRATSSRMSVDTLHSGSSGTSIPPEDDTTHRQSPPIRQSPLSLEEEDEFDEEDARRMSPRRNSEELERIGREARSVIEEQARTLQSGLLALLDRVDKVKEEHDRLDNENRFLQEYIGSLMATSRMTATSGGSSSGQGGRVR